MIIEALGLLKESYVNIINGLITIFKVKTEKN